MTTLTTTTVLPPVPTTVPPTVAAEYARRALRCAVLLKRLDAALWGHGFAAADEPGNAGYVLDLAVAQRRLVESLAQLTGEQADAVERALDDLPAEG